MAVDYGLTYVDLYLAFANTNGELRPELSYDGLHLTPEGYLIWRNKLLEYIRLDY